eukprot:2107_1
MAMQKTMDMVYIVCCSIYAHSVGTNLAYYIHTPNKTLWDAGFHIIPHDKSFETINEILLDIYWTCHCLYYTYPLLFLWKNKDNKIFTATIFIRLCKVMTVSQIFRCFTFLSTSLPGPSP